MGGTITAASEITGPGLAAGLQHGAGWAQLWTELDGILTVAGGPTGPPDAQGSPFAAA